MKKLSISTIIAFIISFSLFPVFSKAQSAPTCSLDPAFIHSGNEGIWPDSAINFISGTVGQPYQQNVTVVIRRDTTVPLLGLCTYSYFKLNASSNNYGLPPGLHLSGTPSNLQFPGNDSSCMVIYGTPSSAGTYTLSFSIGVYCVQTGTLLPITTQAVNYYHITIAPVSSIETNNTYYFLLMPNSPNPVINNTALKFISPSDGKARLAIYDLTGQKIVSQEITMQRGENSYELDASSFENGLYLYSIECNGQKQVRRLVIAR